jgi:hypothetical protein
VKDKVIIMEILPDGEVVLTSDDEFSLAVAEALNDASATKFCEQSELTDVLIGKRMCG